MQKNEFEAINQKESVGQEGCCCDFLTKMSIQTEVFSSRKELAPSRGTNSLKS